MKHEHWSYLFYGAISLQDNIELMLLEVCFEEKSFTTTSIVTSPWRQESAKTYFIDFVEIQSFRIKF